MTQFPRVIQLDESDLNIFENPADKGEWAVTGTFEFSNWTEDDLKGKKRQAFANGWLGVGSFGRSTLVATSPITESELGQVIETLAQHFFERYGAPSVEQARPIATHEVEQVRDACQDQPSNTILTIERTLSDAGVKEGIRSIKPQAADLSSFAVHGS